MKANFCNITLAYNRYCSERKCYCLNRVDILFIENFTFYWSTQATDCPRPVIFQNLLWPKCVIKLCVEIVCDYIEQHSVFVCDPWSCAIIWKPGGHVPQASHFHSLLVALYILLTGTVERAKHFRALLWHHLILNETCGFIQRGPRL